MSNFYTGQTFYGAVKKYRKVVEYKLHWHDEAHQVLYLIDKNTGKKYKVDQYYLGKSIFLSEDNARLAAGLKRKLFYYTKPSRKRKRKEYPQRMYERYERSTDDYTPVTKRSYEDYYFSQRPLQDYNTDD